MFRAQPRKLVISRLDAVLVRKDFKQVGGFDNQAVGILYEDGLHAA